MTNKVSQRVYCVILSCLMVLMLAFGTRGITVCATELPDGILSISYSESSGKMTAVYDGTEILSSQAVYAWYKDGSTIATGTTYFPSAAGVYYCTLRDPNTFDGTLYSQSITLYKVTGANMTFDNTYGLYEAGSTVTVTATLTEGQVVTNWKTSATGVPIPETGTTVTFRMPAQNTTVTATTKTSVSISVYGGTADKYNAYQGETVGITASDLSGQEFVSWSATGGRLGDAKSKSTTLTVGNTNVTVTANFKGTTSSNNNLPASNPESNSNNTEANAVHAVYAILDNAGHSIQVYHHSQGPLCDAAFRYAQGNDWLVIDYFNITLDNSLTTYESDRPVRLQITIPKDLVQSGRHWRMVCVSRGGQIYSFEDEDTIDDKITFTTNRFYAYAMCYNDIVPTVEEPIVIEEPVVEEEPKPVEVTPTNQWQSSQGSMTASSQFHDADTSATTPSSSAATTAAFKPKLKSDQKSAVNAADGAEIPLINM